MSHPRFTGFGSQGQERWAGRGAVASGFQNGPRKCHKCNETGHIARDCSKPRVPSRANGACQTGSSGFQHGPRTCHNCNEAGHVARDCQKPGVTKSANQMSKTDRPTFGFKRMNAFLAEEPGIVIMGIGRNITEWKNLIGGLSSKPETDEFFALILHVLAQKICQVDEILLPNRVEIITNTFQDEFTRKLQRLYSSMFMGEVDVRNHFGSAQRVNIDQSRMGLLQSVYFIFAFVVQRCPNLAADYVSLQVPGAIGVLSTMAIINASDDEEYSENAGKLLLLDKFRQLLEGINALKVKATATVMVRKKFNRNGFTESEEAALHELAPPEDFRDIPITPTIEEILSTEEPFLRTNKIKGSYADANHYLDVHFRLLREDFVCPLRKGIQDFMKHREEYTSRKRKMPMGTVRIYQDVCIKTVCLIRDCMVYNIQLPKTPQFMRIKWEKSKRLLNGSLLVFTPDNFKSAHFAVVAQRDISQLREGIIGVSWENEPPDLDKVYLMVECEVYFEAYRYTLEILKKLELDTFPLARFIVESSDSVSAPSYLEQFDEMLKVGNQHISPLVLPWPSAQELGFSFDENQFQAYQAALTNEFSIIQGPPGTGKTYLGLQIAETFLRNLEAWRTNDEGPILVVCYTNHALDQFLEGIVAIMNKVFPGKDPELVRVGGRSKTEGLEEFSLFKRRLSASRTRWFPHSYAQSKYEATSAVRNLEQQRAALMSETIGLTNLEGLVEVKTLQCYSELESQTSCSILSMMESPELLGFNDPAFNNTNFSSDHLLQKWFRVSQKISNRKPLLPEPQLQQTNHDADDDEDENYDLDELLANRIQEEDEEIKFEMSKKGSTGSIPYLELYSISQCSDVVRNGRYERSVLTEDLKRYNIPKKERDEIQARNRLLANKICLAENRLNFLDLLLGYQRDGLLLLPDMSRHRAGTDLSLQDIRNLSVLERWSIYFTTVEKARLLSMHATKRVNESLLLAQKNLEQIIRFGDGLLLRQTKVVGMTTTGAAKYHDFLQMMKSKIVIVEEAAEVLESHIVTCITRHCQHLILIGDHQQLRPSTTVYDLSQKYYLDISLFERMLKNDLNCFRLKVQHRMRPEIADLVVGTIYEKLENHDSVKHYPGVDGMYKNLFFFDHEEPENSEADSMSKSNEFEASFLAGLCRHLILQGYDPSEITVLTTYTGQMFLLKKKIGNVDSCRGVRVTVVDNYQGEENKIILLSLVRSNDQNNIGFLKTDNRICVAISRAKHGLYICGNMGNLTARSSTWTQIQKKLLVRQEVGKEIKLVCQMHGTVSDVKTDKDFIAKAPEGGCALMCDTLLKCTHICDRACHIRDRNHEDYRCMKNCIKFCTNTHPCRARCYSPCPPCDVKMDKALPCQHVLKLACHVDPTQIQCLVVVEKHKPCGHSAQFACFKDPSSVLCKDIVLKTLECGHSKMDQCHKDAASITCRKLVSKILVPCGHEQKTECWLDPEMVSCDTEVEKEFPDCKHKTVVKCKDKDNSILCKLPCQNRLDCGHQCTKICHPHNDPEHLDYKCKKDCARECENGHGCLPKHVCHGVCPPCKINVEKALSCGIHKSVIPCHVPVASVLCNAPCEEILPVCRHKCTKKCCEECSPCETMVAKRANCGHTLPTKCSELPSPENCDEPVRMIEASICGHDTRVPCRLRNSINRTLALNYCNHACGHTFVPVAMNGKGCQHDCKGTCAECGQGRLHLKCAEECGRVLICGHVCGAPCSADCPPCQKPCLMKCEHSSCRNVCGTPCSDCKEPCTWKCKHKQCTKLCGQDCDRDPCNEPCNKQLKCGHPCIGFCGEPCPPLCRVCDREKLIEFQLYGFEEEEDARFVFLEDCQHCIEAEGLEYYMTMEVEKGEIGIKSCPRCKTTIRHSKRFGNILRSRLRDVMAVKRKIFGDNEAIIRKQSALVDEIANNSGVFGILNTIHHQFKDYLVNKLIQGALRNKGSERGGREPFHSRKVPYTTLLSLDLIWNHGKDVAKVIRNCESELRMLELGSLKTKYKRLFAQLMSRTLPLTNTEVENFENEFDRHYDICEVYKRRGCAAFTPEHRTATPLYNRALDLVQCPRPYTKSVKDELHRLLKELDDSLKSGLRISERERLEILGALKEQRAGRWYKCPNGHLYVIGDCGGATVESRCPECGATIGGADHRVRPDNIFAPEMDGATAPIWPQ